MIEELVNTQIANILNIAKDSKLAESLTFFVYDTIKIVILMFLMISIIGYLRTYVSQNRIRSLVSGRKLGVGNFFASLFGAVTPFCSCSSIPFFMGFIKSGVPLGIAFSFLVTSPLVNEYLVVLMLAAFGWKITLAYVLSGMLIGIASGLVIGKLNMERYIEKEFKAIKTKIKEKIYKTQQERFNFGVNEARKVTKSILLWIILGVGLGAILHGYVPTEFIQKYISQSGWWSVPLATIIGVPLYANCAAIVPVALVLFQKGFPLGTVLAFMMATAALSLPEAIILRRVMKLKLIATFFIIVALGIVLLGYLFNFLSGYLI